METKRAGQIIYNCKVCGTNIVFVHASSVIATSQGFACCIPCECDETLQIPIRDISTLNDLLLSSSPFKAA